MLRFILPAVAALGLTAVAAQSYAPDPTQPQTRPMAWHISHEGDSAKLAYGIESSDLLALMVTCVPGDTTAVVYGDLQPAAAPLVRTSKGATRPDPLSGGDADEARISLGDPVLRGLATHGRMQVTGDAGMTTLRASAQEQRAIGEFFAYCAGGRV
ncbi:hypothetical protein GVN24_33150 [Rhizobium sp. CRIBSB]|nr:hypothetical protein [Rhizobium sp. CRIBSB]